MKRFRRWRFNGAAAVSLALAIVTSCLWMRGLKWRDWFFFAHHDSLVTLGTGAGQFYVGVVHDSGSEFSINRWHEIAPRGDVPGLLSDEGFVWRRPRNPFAAELVFPAWSVIAASLAPPMLWLWRRRRRGQAASACLACGYDLRGSPSPTCPECGAAKLQPVAWYGLVGFMQCASRWRSPGPCSCHASTCSRSSADTRRG